MGPDGTRRPIPTATIRRSGGGGPSRSHRLPAMSCHPRKRYELKDLVDVINGARRHTATNTDSHDPEIGGRGTEQVPPVARDVLSPEKEVRTKGSRRCHKWGPTAHGDQYRQPRS